jgi:type II secretory pathway component PulM
MKLQLQKIQLSDRERSIGILVLLLLFFAINYVFLFPAIQRWSTASRSIEEQRRTLKTTIEFIKRQPDWKERVKELAPFLQSAQARQWSPESADTRLQDLITSLASKHRLTITSTSAVTSESSEYFNELVYNIRNYSAETSDLINFLYDLTQQQQLLQVRAITISPPRNPADTKITGDMTIINLIPKTAPLNSLLALLPPGSFELPVESASENGLETAGASDSVSTGSSTNALEATGSTTNDVEATGSLTNEVETALESDATGENMEDQAPDAEMDGQDALATPDSENLPEPEGEAPGSEPAIQDGNTAAGPDQTVTSQGTESASTDAPQAGPAAPRRDEPAPDAVAPGDRGNGENRPAPRIQGLRMPISNESGSNSRPVRSAPRITIRERNGEPAEKPSTHSSDS